MNVEERGKRTTDEGLNDASRPLSSSVREVEILGTVRVVLVPAGLALCHLAFPSWLKSPKLKGVNRGQVGQGDAEVWFL